MKIIGLTGGIASGKTTVSAYLRKLGAQVIDADDIARQVVAPGEQAWREIKETFGSEYFLPDENLNRKALGQLIFADEKARAKLNAIVHPQVRKRFQQETEKGAQKGLQAIVWAVPLLLESSMDKIVDEVWLVAVREEEQLERLIKRDLLDRASALARINAQMSLAEKIKRADKIIDANVGKEDMYKQVAALWREATCC
ncbi:dephospho-CoA kinase [Heliorestis acidaminivorans]|uniref:Dephospho-CoA kinase n=1 Tax=Heliorestis acidaminivorans TaxID=553427 RepID=A0A6I0EPK4_9FIRM|nr:dephospho-CoA kinase [Heliorestis acidaminivorans]KAB2951858.1 dephospho-CoA kinase [Heliorestis acidaminivorans]